MSARVVRMLNGEDVIADVKEVRKDEDTPGAVAYVFEKPFTVQIIDHTESQMLFETPGDTTSPSPQKINDLELKFYPYAPLALKDGVVAAVQHVALIYDPHPSVMEKYLELTKAMEEPDGKLEVDNTHRPEDVPTGETTGDGRGTESTD